MSYRIVAKAEHSPGCCFITGDYDGPFVDLGPKVVGPRGEVQRIYLHTPVVKTAARQLGMVDQAEVDAAWEAAEHAQEWAAELEAKAAAWDAYRNVIREPEEIAA